jgi:uncharacterized protein (TIGR03435 family)
MMRHAAAAVALASALISSPLAQGTAPTEKLSFEVASIKPNKETSGGSWSMSGGRQTIIGTTATVLIMSAFNVHDYEVIGAPSWSHSERFDVIVQPKENPRGRSRV